MFKRPEHIHLITLMPLKNEVQKGMNKKNQNNKMYDGKLRLGSWTGKKETNKKAVKCE